VGGREGEGGGEREMAHPFFFAGLPPSTPMASTGAWLLDSAVTLALLGAMALGFYACFPPIFLLSKQVFLKVPCSY